MNPQPPNPPPQGQQVNRFLRPEQMRTIQYLSVQEKQRYEEGLQTLWAKVEQNPPESQEHQAAKQKILEFSRMVMNKIKALHERNRGNLQGQANLAGTQQQQPNQVVQGQSQIQTQAQAQVQAQAQAQAQAQVQSNAQAQAQAQIHAQAQAHAQAQLQAQTQGVVAVGQKPTIPLNRPQAPPVNSNPVASAVVPPNVPTVGVPTAVAAPAATATATTGSTGTAGQSSIPRHILEHVSKLPWTLLPIPTQFTQEQGQKWLAETKSKYARALFQLEATRNRMAKYDAVLKDRQEKGIPTPPDEMKRIQEIKSQDKKVNAEAEAYVKNLQSSFQPGRPQAMQRGNSSGVASTHPMQVPTASINAAMDAAKTTQIVAANRVGTVGGPQVSSQSQQPQQSQAPPPPASNPTPTQTPVTPATPTTSAPAQTPHPVPAPPTQGKLDSTASTQHPPPVNTALAAAPSAHIPSAGTPTQASARVQTPQSAQPPAGGSVRALTHAAAVNRANSSTNITGQPNNSSTGMATNTPNIAAMAAQPGHTHAHPPPTHSTPTLTSKMPIPKTLPEKATAPPQPVVVGGGNTPGRPTYGGGNGSGGVMNQPVISKMPVPQFDAEGDHVLSKKKLDELIRQVCGGGSPGADGNYLTPDVEESVLSVADNFVDNVLHMACRLAKERGSKVLEIRDIQLVLERVYNIRIPGYTSDELRTVRKVQPSSNWIAKMSAIQAAKVTSGKDDK